MTAKYSADFIVAVRSLHVRSLGQHLAVLCIEGNLPSAYVAQVLGVSRVTMHSWFRGQTIREHRVPRVEAFMRLVKDDLKNGVLPAKDLKQAKAYLQEMCDAPIRNAHATSSD